MKKCNKYSVLGLQALRRAVLKVQQEAKKNNYKIAYMKDGDLTIEVPDIIAEQPIASDAKNR